MSGITSLEDARELTTITMEQVNVPRITHEIVIVGAAMSCESPDKLTK